MNNDGKKEYNMRSGADLPIYNKPESYESFGQMKSHIRIRKM